MLQNVIRISEGGSTGDTNEMGGKKGKKQIVSISKKERRKLAETDINGSTVFISSIILIRKRNKRDKGESGPYKPYTKIEFRNRKWGDPLELLTIRRSDSIEVCLSNGGTATLDGKDLEVDETSLPEIFHSSPLTDHGFHPMPRSQGQ